ncbi:MAG: TRAP transporter small permease [Sphingomonadaceae bacterium]
MGWKRAIIWIGGLALMAAAGIDTLAVIGRHVGMPVRGSIELIQVAILLGGSIGIFITTLAAAHARVLLLLDRLQPGTRRIVSGLGEVLTALFLLLVLAGSVWISADLWNAHEVSEITGIPWSWMRVTANIFLGLSVLAALLPLFRPTSQDVGHEGHLP